MKNIIFIQILTLVMCISSFGNSCPKFKKNYTNKFSVKPKSSIYIDIIQKNCNEISFSLNNKDTTGFFRLAFEGSYFVDGKVHLITDNESVKLSYKAIFRENSLLIGTFSQVGSEQWYYLHKFTLERNGYDLKYKGFSFITKKEFKGLTHSGSSSTTTNYHSLF